MDTDTWVIVGVVVLVLVLLGAALLLANRRRTQTRNLKERFGPEYERRVEEYGSEKDARERLDDVRERREQLDIRDLEPAARERYVQRWSYLQSEFVDRPGPAVDEANNIVQDVMRERGYPVDDFETRADLISADHPDVVQDYRAASDARRRHHDSGSEATTEDLRRAMVHYRSLFERLVGGVSDTAGGDGGAPSTGRHSG
jgi:hypothetical protein